MTKLAIFNALAVAIVIPGVSNAFFSASTVRFAGKSKMLLTKPVFMRAEGVSTRGKCNDVSGLDILLLLAVLPRTYCDTASHHSCVLVFDGQIYSSFFCSLPS